MAVSVTEQEIDPLITALESCFKDRPIPESTN
jgi:hypothetical protein